MAEEAVKSSSKKALSKDEFKTEVLSDFRLAVESRQASLIGRKEVLTEKPSSAYSETVRRLHR